MAVADGLIEYFTTWWAVWLLAAGPFLLSTGVASAFHSATRLLDRARRDDLPRHAGEWVRGRIAELGLAGELEVGLAPHHAASVDAFWPLAGYIGLSRKTFYRRDGAHWAIAAHELGHALTLRASAWLAAILPAARAVTIAADRAAIAFLLGATVLGSDLVVHAALAAWVVAAASSALVLADEAVASGRAWAMLRSEPRMGASDRRRAAVALAVALATYGASTAGRLAVLALWPWLGPWLAAVAAPADPGPLQWRGVLWMFALTLLLGKRAARVTWNAVRPPRTVHAMELSRLEARDALGDLAGGAGAAMAIAVLWDAPLGPAWPVAVALAAVPALVPLASLGRTVVLLPAAMVLREVERADHKLALYDGHIRGEEPVAGPAEPPPRTVLDLHGAPPFTLRAMALLRVLYVPMVGLWWAGWIGGAV